MIKALENEYGPTPRAELLYPHAAMSSVTPFPSPVFAIPEQQQSKSMRTSFCACSKRAWIPLHVRVGGGVPLTFDHLHKY
jgi:hypothetical protein